MKLLLILISGVVFLLENWLYISIINKVCVSKTKQLADVAEKTLQTTNDNSGKLKLITESYTCLGGVWWE